MSPDEPLPDYKIPRPLPRKDVPKIPIQDEREPVETPVYDLEISGESLACDACEQVTDVASVKVFSGRRVCPVCFQTLNQPSEAIRASTVTRSTNPIEGRGNRSFVASVVAWLLLIGCVVLAAYLSFMAFGLAVLVPFDQNVATEKKLMSFLIGVGLFAIAGLAAHRARQIKRGIDRNH